MTNLTHNSFLYMFISILYMFRTFKCSSSGDSIVSIRYLEYVTQCRWPSGMQVWTERPNLPGSGGTDWRLPAINIVGVLYHKL